MNEWTLLIRDVTIVFRVSEPLRSHWMNAVNSFITRSVSLASVWERSYALFSAADDYSASLDL